MPGEEFRVFTEIPNNEKMIVNMVTNDQLTLEDACDLLNKQDQQIQQIKTILTDMTEETFNDRIKNDDREDLLEYYKGKHDAIGDVNKRILEVLLK